jgi:hypothetical protein
MSRSMSDLSYVSKELKSGLSSKVEVIEASPWDSDDDDDDFDDDDDDDDDDDKKPTEFFLETCPMLPWYNGLDCISSIALYSV